MINSIEWEKRLTMLLSLSRTFPFDHFFFFALPPEPPDESFAGFFGCAALAGMFENDLKENFDEYFVNSKQETNVWIHIRRHLVYFFILPVSTFT